MIRQIGGMGVWLLATTALVCPGGAWAAEQPAGDARLAQARAVEAFAIPSQPLETALAAFSAQTRIQVLAKGEVTRALTSPGVTGTLAAEEALRWLLAGTGLTYRFTDPGTVILDKAAADGALTLDPVTVEGDTPRGEESAWGPVRGYVAKRSASGTKTDTPLAETP